jgi:ABC-type uncharacterized transport system permease subunit
MTVVGVSFVLSAALYAVACGAFFVHLARGTKPSAHWAMRTLAAAMAAHATYLISDFAISGRHPLEGIQQTLAVLSLLIALAYLATMRRHGMTAIGAFITPVTLLMLLGAGLRSSLPPVPEHVVSALLPVHIAMNVLGLVAFTLAFAAAVGYVIQERLLRTKHVIGVFQRLPALEELDSLGGRFVTIGFPMFTLGLMLGIVWAAQQSALSAAQGFAMLAWLFFGIVLLTRAVAGWNGRRAAIGTMLGFMCAMVALGGYWLRGLGG